MLKPKMLTLVNSILVYIFLIVFVILIYVNKLNRILHIEGFTPYNVIKFVQAEACSILFKINCKYKFILFMNCTKSLARTVSKTLTLFLNTSLLLSLWPAAER